MALTPPLYCAICAAPCFLPRRAISCPAKEPLAAASDKNAIPAESDASGNAHGHGWLHEWHVLQVATGLQTSPLINPISASTPSAPNNPRSVPLHDYCLNAVLKTIIHSVYSSGYSHEESMIIGWSLPKWTDYGPWVREADRGGAGFVKDMEKRGIGIGYWAGCVDQRKRWREGAEGSHLLPEDYVSPINLGKPERSINSHIRTRPQQSHAFYQLPTHVLTQICLHLLVDPSLSTLDADHMVTRIHNLLPETAIKDFLSFSRSCAHLYYLDFPSNFWKLLILDSVARYTSSLLARWRANPTGVGSASNLWMALDEAFTAPLKEALDSVSIDEESHVSVRDVWQWWKYNEGWRSRRRVWYCVVHACSTARDADWW